MALGVWLVCQTVWTDNWPVAAPGHAAMTQETRVQVCEAPPEGEYVTEGDQAYYAVGWWVRVQVRLALDLDGSEYRGWETVARTFVAPKTP